MTDTIHSRLSGPGGPLAVARPAGAHRFLCQGDRASIGIADRAGVESVHVDGFCASRHLQTDFGPCSNVVGTPGRARRELHGPDGVMLEDVFALPRLPGALVQWTPPDGRAFTATLRWLGPGGGRPQRDGTRMHLAPAADGVTHTLFRIQPEPENWAVEQDQAGWNLRARIQVPAGGTLSWIVGAAPKVAIANAAVAALDRLEPQEAVQGGWLRELEGEHLRTRTGIHEIDSALEWAKARASGHDSASLARLLAQLGAGLLREARITLDTLAEDHSADFGRGLGAYLMWSGEHDAPASYRSHLRDWLAAAADAGAAVGADAGARPHSEHTQLIEALDGLGYPEEAGEVRALSLKSSGTGALVLPMAGQPSTKVPPPDPESIWLRFRVLTEACSAGVLDPDDDRAADPAYALIQVLLDDILQVEAEASLGRLRMAPTFPEHLTSFQVEGIRLGQGGIDFRMDRDGDRYRYLFQPTSGALPLNLTFEPSLLGTALTEARVDGDPAELDWTSEGRRITPRLQLPVDRERTVELQVGRKEID